MFTSKESVAASKGLSVNIFSMTIPRASPATPAITLPRCLDFAVQFCCTQEHIPASAHFLYKFGFMKLSSFKRKIYVFLGPAPRIYCTGR